MVSRDPKRAAKKILSDLGVSDLIGLSLKDVVQYCGPFVKEERLSGSQGRIQFLGSSSVITINSVIKGTGHKQFVLAHEFGHANLHADLKSFFNCDEDSFKIWMQKGQQEKEANEFAAELLMPASVFRAACQRSEFSIELVKRLSVLFQTSLSSCCIRLAEIGPFPMAVVYSENNVVKWSVTSGAFPLNHIIRGSQTPPESVAHQWFKNKADKPRKMKSGIWFGLDYNQFKQKDTYMKESILPIEYYNGVFSFLTLV